MNIEELNPIPIPDGVTTEEMYFILLRWTRRHERLMAAIRYRLSPSMQDEGDNSFELRQDILRVMVEHRDSMNLNVLTREMAGRAKDEVIAPVKIALNLLLENPQYFNKKVDWVKHFRTDTGMPLRESKEAVDIAQNMAKTNSEILAMAELCK